MSQNKLQNELKIASGDLLSWSEAFLFDCQSARLSPRTIDYYRCSLEHFLRYCTDQGITQINSINPDLLRCYLLWLKQTHNAGGVHAKYRAIRAFLNWYENEIDDPTYRNPMRKIKVKPVKIEPLEPADIYAIQAILADCKVSIPYHPHWLGLRDTAILLMLIDTGLRANELLSLTVNAINPITGIIHLIHGKGEEPRTVYISRKTRQAYRRYFQAVKPEDRVFLNEKRDILTNSGLRQMLEVRCARAGVPMQTPHSFRRLCALTLYRTSGDIYAVQRYLGHRSISTTLRYLRLTESDALAAHKAGSPVDVLLKK